MYDDNYTDDLSAHDADLLEAQADLLLGEGIGDDLGDDDLGIIPVKKSHIDGDDELEDLDTLEDDLDSFDFADDLEDDLDTEI